MKQFKAFCNFILFSFFFTIINKIIYTLISSFISSEFINPCKHLIGQNEFLILACLTNGMKTFGIIIVLSVSQNVLISHELYFISENINKQSFIT